MVEKLREYGFSYEEIICYRKDLLSFIPAKEVIKGIEARFQDLNEINRDAVKLIENNKKDLMEFFTDKITYFESLIYIALGDNSKPTQVLFYRNRIEEGGYIILYPNINELLTTNSELQNEMLKFKNQSHFMLSINEIINRFIATDNKNQTRLIEEVITEQEYKIITAIRKNLKTIRSIKVHFQNSEPTLIKLEKQKSVKIETRLMELIQRGEYKKIVVDTEKANICSYRDITSIKL